LRVVKKLSAQFAFPVIAALAVTALASASTTSTHKQQQTQAKLHSTSTTHHSSSHSSSRHSSSSHSSSTHSASAHSSHTKHGKQTAHKSWKSQGQHGISSDRTREIQEALIREHYMDGEATGVWDTKTQEACRKFQTDNGWQNKVLPDSRALIKLGLGPDHKDVLNPETAATSPYLPGGGVKSSESGSIAPADSAVQAPEQ